jgi:hypothetical protein
MKPIAAWLALLFAVTVPAWAQNTERTLSVPDAVPACMERNGPDCVLKSDVAGPRAAAGGNVPPTIPVTPPVEVPPPGTVGLVPAAPSTGLPAGAASVPATTVTTPSGTTVVVTPNANTTSSGFTTNPNSIGGNLQSSGGTTGTSTSSGFTTNPNSIGGALNSGPASTPGTATTGAGSVRR